MFRFEFFEEGEVIHFNISLARLVTFDDAGKKIVFIFTDNYKILCDYEGREKNGDKFYDYESAKTILKRLLINM